MVIGSGYRARNAFLPALTCLDSDVEVVGVCSRNFAHAREAAQQFGVEAIEDLRSLRPGDVDVVLVSVTPASILAVLRATAHIAPGAALVMDTPAMAGLGDLRHLALYRRWRTVRVGEDFMNMPQFRLVGKVIDSGALGDVVSIRLTNMGFAYHALALLRSWLGYPLVRSARSRRWRRGAVDLVYRFPGGVIAEVIEPYTRGEGFIDVAGTRASITGHMMGCDIGNRAAPVGDMAHGARGHLERLEDESGLSGYQIVGLGAEFTTGVPSMARLRTMGIEDDSELNLIRIDGLCRVISSLWTPDPVNTQYRLQDAMADVVVSFAARPLPWWPIPQIAGRNLVDLVESAFSPFTQLRRSTAMTDEHA
ncbi:Gfo/Idh/MocA family protein [Mycobacterium sp. SP-6446]|uniref:Gfo/Idh/MocA family protein n=1 Tax=Mycobacterium sp. SP-6446 TaxID=1834162 RepID=UPI0020C96A7B|nr:Gfo/Idh/MocA family oxidoreductase [Mycobacterium sp. SP-6446]